MSADGAVDLVQQVRAHLESLRAAGVLLVPRGERLAPRRLVAPPIFVAPVEAVPNAPNPIETRRQELTVLAKEIENCDKCSELFAVRTQPVFGAGPLDPEVAFVGDAPGSEEDAQGEPFVGKGGQLLRRIIAACQLPSSQEYLLNIIKCRPPRNRAPTMAECGNCRDFFRRQFELVNPKYVVALGLTAAKLLTGKNLTMSALRGQVHEYRGVPLICTHHPNDIEKDATERVKRETWEDMKLLLRTMGRSVPGAK
ncbi:Uracil DNA glycosylase superfamily protein [Gemmata sp. SH-PL17]|uniref:uracil-DNA glycosylase n=1 Tax=Gemmata sp. SH-PL17 TaxID=1630693 RepID=UPI0004B8FEBB|nr:uracil-DNA glycosylase [Gemmata sp. SH-PL17]AMV29123.1 Uracil DNA glycosylase superfamily protein [Gemmata sp. SH-PL17]